MHFPENYCIFIPKIIDTSFRRLWTFHSDEYGFCTFCTICTIPYLMCVDVFALGGQFLMS